MGLFQKPSEMIRHVLKPLDYLPKIAWVATFLSTVFVGLVVHDTMSDSTDNIKMGEFNYVRGWNNSIGLVVEYSRGFTIYKTADGEVQRIIRCPPEGFTQDTYFIEGSPTKRTFKKGYYPPVIRPMQFPVAVPTGTKCRMEVWGVWQPRFAISSKRWMLDSHDFIVEARR